MNRLTLAVAGGRKTQSIVDACLTAPLNTRILVLGYTLASQDELERRITTAAPFRPNVDVLGWYSFLLRHLIRPYLPLKYPGHRLSGFNFDGEPVAGFKASGASRYLDREDRAYRLHLSKLAMDVLEASGGSGVDRLEHIYTDIYVDEVQDLCGTDLDVIATLLESKIRVHLVGDVRQALLATNVRDPRYKKYRFDKIIDWFRLQEKAKRLEIIEQPTTFRSNQIIATFSDTVFDASCGYEPTVSVAESKTSHDGIFAVRLADVAAYCDQFTPLCIRHSSSSGQDLDLPFRTFGTVKGITVERVLIYPTAPIRKFLTEGKPLTGKSACGLYIGITRARHSVAFILETEDQHDLTIWEQQPTGV